MNDKVTMNPYYEEQKSTEEKLPVPVLYGSLPLPYVICSQMVEKFLGRYNLENVYACDSEGVRPMIADDYEAAPHRLQQISGDLFIGKGKIGGGNYLYRFDFTSGQLVCCGGPWKWCGVYLTAIGDKIITYNQEIVNEEQELLHRETTKAKQKLFLKIWQLTSGGEKILLQQLEMDSGLLKHEFFSVSAQECLNFDINSHRSIALVANATSRKRIDYFQFFSLETNLLTNSKCFDAKHELFCSQPELEKNIHGSLILHFSDYVLIFLLLSGGLLQTWKLDREKLDEKKLDGEKPDEKKPDEKFTRTTLVRKNRIPFALKRRHSPPVFPVVYDDCVLINDEEKEKIWMIDIFTLEIRGSMHIIPGESEFGYCRDERHNFFFPFPDAKQRKRDWIKKLSALGETIQTIQVPGLLGIIADYLTGIYGLGNEFYVDT